MCLCLLRIISRLSEGALGCNDNGSHTRNKIRPASLGSATVGHSTKLQSDCDIVDVIDANGEKKPMRRLRLSLIEKMKELPEMMEDEDDAHGNHDSDGDKVRELTTSSRIDVECVY